MNTLKDESKLIEIVIPGSHDAGSYTMISQAKTQSTSIYDQLVAGVRYLDLRVRYAKNKLVIFHGPINGISFDEVLEDLCRFQQQYPDQLIILDFQHFEDQAEKETAQKLAQKIKTKSIPNQIKINEIKMKDIRDNNWSFLILFSHPPVSFDFIFSRSSSLLSPYQSHFHQGSPEDLIQHGFPMYFNQKQADKLFVLQAQKTAKYFWESPINLEKKFYPIFNQFIKNHTNQDLSRFNIIMRDFINTIPENISLIIQLNENKHLLKK